MIAGNPIWNQNVAALAARGRALYTFEIPDEALIITSFIPSDVNVTLDLATLIGNNPSPPTLWWQAQAAATARETLYLLPVLGAQQQGTPDGMNPPGIAAPPVAKVTKIAFNSFSLGSVACLYWGYGNVPSGIDFSRAGSIDLQITSQINEGDAGDYEPWGSVQVTTSGTAPDALNLIANPWPTAWVYYQTPSGVPVINTLPLWTGPGAGFPDLAKIGIQIALRGAIPAGPYSNPPSFTVSPVLIIKFPGIVVGSGGGGGGGAGFTTFEQNIRVLPYLKIPTGQGQSVNELEGSSSISSMDVEAIDPSNELKYLATKTELVGKKVILKMGFPGMNLSDFVPLHTMQISDVGRTADGWIRFGCRDALAVLDRALWFCGGPQPVAPPWLYGQAYLLGQFIQDSNGNIEQCIAPGISDADDPPVWPGTVEPGWGPNTSYTLGSWVTDRNGNLQQLTTVPSGSSSSRPLNTGVSGNGFPPPAWSTVLDGTTVDNSGGNPNGPLTWTLIAINQLGQEVTDGAVTWELVAKPYQGAFGGSQAFYVYSLYGQTIQVPEPPARFAFISNQWPTLDGNPRYIYGNPIDAFLVALQNELGVGQDPSLPPIVTSDPNNPQNALVFAPNPAWQQYIPGDDSTLINPNPGLDVSSILAVRDYQASGRKFEWCVKRPVTAKSWIEQEIMKPLGLYMLVHNDGSIGLKSMGQPPSAAPVAVDANSIEGTPEQATIAVVNVVTVRGDVNDEGAYSAARVYDAELTFAQKQSLAVYLQEFSQSCESSGLRLAYDSYGVAYSLADRVFRRHGFSTPEYAIGAHLNQVRLELGDSILLSHPLMLDYESETGRLGIVNILCEIVDRQPDYSSGKVTLKVWDTRFMKLAGVYKIAPLADAIPGWPSASAAQKAEYMFISFFPGFYSDGTPGNTIATDASGPVVLEALAAPPAPEGLAVVPGNAEVFLSWGESLSATSYNVKRATTSGGPYTTVGNTPEPFFTDTGLSNGTTYYYVVSALNAAGEGANSAQISATPEV